MNGTSRLASVRSAFASKLVIATLVLLAAGCGGGSRPTMLTWQPDWETAVSHSLPVDGSSVAQADCAEILAAASAARAQLDPTPDRALDNPINQWIVLAESVGADCLDHPDIVGATSTLHDLEASIDETIQSLQPNK